MDIKKVEKYAIIVASVLLIILISVLGYLKYMNTPTAVGADLIKSKKSLVVYYSRKDSVEKIAQTIAKKVGADIYKLEPREAYPEEDKEYITRLKSEKRSAKLVDLKSPIPNLNNYDVIYVGTPIVLYTSTPIVNTFLRSGKFDNKIIMPFTSYSDKTIIPEGIYNMKKYVPTAYYKNTMLVKGDGGNSLDIKIAIWLSEVRLNKWEKKKWLKR